MTNLPAGSPIPDEQALPILRVIGIMGAATRIQIQDYLAHPHLMATLTGEADTCWSRKTTRTRTDHVLEQKLVAVLPSTGRYYSGQPAGSQVVLELTQKGRERLKAADIGVPKMTFTEPSAILHALAILDVRMALLSHPDIATVDTDQPLGNVRPDNLAKWAPDANKRWTLFESELQGEWGTVPRIQKKLQRLARFYLSSAADHCDRAVRIIYLWKPLTDKDADTPQSKKLGDHEKALEVWRNACWSVRVQMPGRQLPFHLYFMSHREFLANPDAPLDAYEYLAATGADPLPSPSADGTADPNNETSDADSPDEEALAWILGFDREVRRGIDTKQQQNNLLRACNEFLDTHLKYRVALQPLISAYMAANATEAPRRLEFIGAELLRNIGFPSLPPGVVDIESSKSEEVFPILPMGIAGSGEPARLKFIITQSRRPMIQAMLPQGSQPEHLSQALSMFVKYAIMERSALDMVVSGNRMTAKRSKKPNK